MSKRHADSTPDEKAPKRRKLSADEVLVEAARNGDTTAVRAGLEKLSPDTDSKTVSFDAVHEACRGNHDECLALLLPYVETTQMGFGMLLSECIHADHTACTEVLLQHWKSLCSNVAFVPHGKEEEEDRPCPAMWEDPAVCQVLIDAGADIETKDDRGRSPLHMACCSGALVIVKMLVKAGADVSATDNERDTCLTLAAYFGHTETVRYLVSFPELDVNHKDTDGHTALRLAADQNHPDVLKVLIDAGADIETKNKEGCSPLFMASKDGALGTVKMLVKAGADVCGTHHTGETCLTFAASHGHTETVRYLVSLPEVDVNQVGDDFTALHWAGQEDYHNMATVLIDAGADMDAEDENGCSPLLRASKEGCLDTVKMLLKAGADVCAADNKGATCLALAVWNGHTETVCYLLCLPEVDVNRSNNSGASALHVAVFRKHSDVVGMLIDAGADVEAKSDVVGRTPLHCACEVGEREIVRMLLKAGADLCVTDDDGDRCLALAAHHGHIETVRYLVGLREVDVNHGINEDNTALAHAGLNGHAGVEQVLLEHGGEVFVQ